MVSILGCCWEYLFFESFRENPKSCPQNLQTRKFNKAKLLVSLCPLGKSLHLAIHLLVRQSNYQNSLPGLTSKSLKRNLIIKAWKYTSRQVLRAIIKYLFFLSVQKRDGICIKFQNCFSFCNLVMNNFQFLLLHWFVYMTSIPVLEIFSCNWYFQILMSPLPSPVVYLLDFWGFTDSTCFQLVLVKYW